jgi:hypothetical protein
MADDEAVVAARRWLHVIAEQVLAGPQYRTSGTIRLAVTASGFATVAPPAAGVESLAVADGILAREPGGAVVTLIGPLTGIAAAAGVEPGPAEGVYPAPAQAPPEGPADVPPDGARVVLGALAAGAQALRELAPDGPEPVLWPEHFDVAITLDEVNYGVSPGDEGHPRPYAYVGPWMPRAGEFWNEPFGASRPVAELGDAAGIAAFLRAGRDRAVADPPA